MPDMYDVIVVGLGAMGSAATRQLARRGIRVLALDRYELGHTNGSSHGHHRLIRRSQYRSGHDALIDRAFVLWRELEAETGQDILRLIGEVSLGYVDPDSRYQRPAADPTIGGIREVLDEVTLRERFPGFRWYEGMTATYESEAGYLRPEVAIAANLDVAQRHGAEIRRPEAMQCWEVDGDGVRVVTDRGEYLADRLVIAGGPWASVLLPELNLLLEVVRIVNVYFQPDRPDLWTAEQGAPDFLLSVPEGSYYGMPSIEGIGLKIGRHENGEPATPWTIRREVDEAEVEDLRAVLDRYMPGAAGRVMATLTCMYTMTPDENYIVERHPQHQQVAYACGFSGTGFKFSVTIGEILADLATDGETRFDLSPMVSRRFQDMIV